MDWTAPHILRVAGDTETFPEPITDGQMAQLRKKVEPWLSAIFQSEHLSLLLGSGFTSAVAFEAGATAAAMNRVTFGCAHEAKVNEHATAAAARMGRGEPNIEDQLSAAFALHAGLSILGDGEAANWKTAIDREMRNFLLALAATERGVRDGFDRARIPDRAVARDLLASFLMSFASRAATRERLHIFTTNYDRLIERGCDLAGLRLIDRFVGSLEPEFRSSRLQVDFHYTPPGVRGEPRHLEGVVHFTKLHGSLDWRYEKPRLFRTPLPFAPVDTHPGVPQEPRDSVMIYPNSVKDVETAAFPYADLFRDFSAALCRPNSVLITFGYGFGDDHVNRIIADMLTLPSTHLTIIAWGEAPHERIAKFVQSIGHPQQISLLLGKHFGDIRNLVESYLPKPAIDPLTLRMAELIERRATWYKPPEGHEEPASTPVPNSTT